MRTYIEQKWIRITLVALVLAVWTGVVIRALQGLTTGDQPANTALYDGRPELSPILDVPYLAGFEGAFRDPFAPQWPAELTQKYPNEAEGNSASDDGAGPEAVQAAILQSFRLSGIVGGTAVLEEATGTIHVVAEGDRIPVTDDPAGTDSLALGDRPLEEIVVGQVTTNEIELTMGAISRILTLRP